LLKLFYVKEKLQQGAQSILYHARARLAPFYFILFERKQTSSASPAFYIFFFIFERKRAGSRKRV